MTYLVQIAFPYYTGLPEDVVTNTWHFDRPGGAPGEGAFADLLDHFSTFYETIWQTPANLGPAPWLRPLLNTLKVYDLDDAIPRPPIYEAGVPLTLGTTPTTSSLPPEVAICLSYQADPIPGVNQQTRRGRIYLGGFALLTGAGSTTSFPNTSSAARTIIADAASLFGAAMSVDGWEWVVYSRKLGTSAIVTNGWVDDEIDTQRRRGRGPTARTAFGIV